MAPPPAVSIIAGITWRDTRNMLSTLTRMMRRQSSTAVSMTLPRPPIPTLLSSRSSRPNCPTAASTRARHCRSSATSATKAAALPPSCSIIETVCSAASRRISTTSTQAPARASRIAAARPLPIPSSGAPPPVTIATLPARPRSSGRECGSLMPNLACLVAYDTGHRSAAPQLLLYGRCSPAGESPISLCMTVAFDPLKRARRLEAAGFSTKQAQDTAEALGDTLTATVATQADIQTLQADIRSVEVSLRTKIREVELRSRAEMMQMKAELRAEIAALRVEIIKWVVGVGVAGVLAVAGILLALMRMLPHP